MVDVCGCGHERQSRRGPGRSCRAGWQTPGSGETRPQDWKMIIRGVESEPRHPPHGAAITPGFTCVSPGRAA